MLYLKCPTCKELLGNRQLIYEELYDQLLLNPDLSEKEKDLKKQELVNSLGLKLYCCKVRMITYIRLIDIIK